MDNLTKIIQNRPILNEPYKSINNFVSMLLGKVQVFAGQLIEDEIFNITLEELKKDLMTSYRGLTLLEVEYALINGAKGLYGDFYGLNMKTFTRWLNDYQMSPERLEAINRKNRIDVSKQISEKGSVTNEEFNRIAINKALDDFTSYKARKSIIDLGCTTYSFLMQIGILRLSDEEKWGLYHEAENIFHEKRKSGCKSIYEIAEISVREELSQKNEIVRISKNLALKKYFDKIIDNETDLEKLLKEKNNE